MKNFDWNSKDWDDMETSVFETDAFRYAVIIVVLLAIIARTS